jgi:hypothetical protein
MWKKLAICLSKTDLIKATLERIPDVLNTAAASTVSGISL